MPRKLYHTFLGRCLLKVLTLPALSKLAGLYMDSFFSKPYIGYFIKNNNINTDECKIENWKCFNEFFTRRLKDGVRPVTMQANILVSPCDGFLTVYEINDSSVFRIKDSLYTPGELLDGNDAASEYAGGLCLVFRLTPSDYHRYIYPDNGTKSGNTFIKGILHTVRPVAHDVYPVFKTNSREYTILHTDNFDDIIFMEVGAMLVGKICNFHGEHTFKRGEEKGMFEFGGSTIIMLLKKEIAVIDPEITDANSRESEYRVRLGQEIGKRK